MVVGELAYERDLIIIGGGPGGYHAAIRAAQLGQSVTLIEKDKLGGVCLNKGCIPSKVLTHSADQFASLHHMNEMGIEMNSARFNMEKLQIYKSKTIQQLREGVQSLCKANKIEILQGSAFFLSEDKIGVENDDQYEIYRFKHAIIATGSTPIAPEGINVDQERILDSWSITDLQTVPEKLVVYGHDYIALEIAMSFNAIGSEVVLIMEQDDFMLDASVSRELKRILKKNEIKVRKNTSIVEAKYNDGQVTVILKSPTDIEEITCSHLFISCKNSPNTNDLGINRIGIETTGSGFITVNEECRTSKNHIFAIGDVTEGPNLAVKAIKQGKTAAEIIAGLRPEADIRFLPIVVHTRPQIAYAGLTEAEAINHGYSVETAQFPLSSNGYAAIQGKKEGLIKVVFDKNDHLLLGVHIIGNGAVELISTGVQSLEMAARDEDILFPLYPHPSINEGLLEAVEAIKNQAIHLPPVRNKESIKL
ncbi:dihydrolipoyl dehydrogenase [Bacillus sp. S/N-304-OC-R1]|uniref:dihydrolipoyl dehydrogenase n=1 Tax=Bacillus sp. S/N-304-OC-R1 TaxID=2758034 RepID=UPI001C8D18E2|nr:dihydrolipoyl dehydrogenase [Bacillus sp. S/N-304-OC-R1]MBY0120545.1 dihydrolipoyl dehydrogenase [Bacillus sp. S/N-304-OC-R1]